MAQPTLAPLRRWDPEQIGPYVLLGRLGAGAMGQVYLGRSAAGRLVAVKTIKIELAEEPGFRAHFAHEVAAARRVSGLFTAPVVAADADADVPWLATAYIPAPSLTRLVKATGPQPVATVWWLAAGGAEALESIHATGLVHRDLKPSNVLVAPDGPRVIDFGVARAAERIELTVTRGAVGTPAYMAPEQARDPRQASVASDVYALGATLLYAATGHPPYRGETVMDVLVRLATQPPDLTGLPDELTEVVTGCLARSPVDRPSSAALLARLAPMVAHATDEGADNPAHGFLSPAAMALIGTYRRRPQTTGSAGEPGLSVPELSASELSESGLSESGLDDSALGELSELSDPALVSQPSAAGEDGATYASVLSAPAGGPRSAWRRALTWAQLGRAAAVIALVGAGTLIGAQLTHSGGGQTGGRAGASTSAGVSQPTPPPVVPSSTYPGLPASRAAIGMVQKQGDGSTGFVVHGVGFRPFSTVRVTLSGDGTVIRREVDFAGTFNYEIDQGHRFYRGPIPVGRHGVIVTGLGRHGRRRLTTSFNVIAPPPAPGPGGSPPAGPPPGGGSPP